MAGVYHRKKKAKTMRCRMTGKSRRSPQPIRHFHYWTRYSKLRLNKLRPMSNLDTSPKKKGRDGLLGS